MFNVIYFSKAPKDSCGKMLLARCYNLGKRASDYSTGERPSCLTFAFTLRPDAVTPQRGSPNHPQPPPTTSSSPTSPRPLLDFLQTWTSKMTVPSGTCLLCCPHIRLIALSTRPLVIPDDSLHRLPPTRLSLICSWDRLFANPFFPVLSPQINPHALPLQHFLQLVRSLEQCLLLLPHGGHPHQEN